MEKGKARKICVSTARMANVLKMGGGTNELKVLKNWDRVSGGKKGKKNRGPFCHLTNTFVDLCRVVWLIFSVSLLLHKKPMICR
jgi:hypothetical protein